MQKVDSLQRFIFENAPVRGELIRLQLSYQTILNQHPYPAPIRKLLGEALCVSALLSAIIKFNGRLTVQFRGKGKLKLLLAQCDNNFHIRGLAKWDGELTEDDLLEAFNDGVLVIMLDAAPGKPPYQGVVSWVGNSLIESIQGYFKHSEQLATKLWLEVNEHTAAGLLLQVIPASDRGSKAIESEIIQPHWEHILKLSDSLLPTDLLKLDTESLLKQLYPEEDIRIFAPDAIAFQCTCSRKRGEDAIYILGREEAEAELKDKQTIAVTCDFCNEEYLFDPIDVAKIFEDKDRPPPNKNLH